MPQTAAAEAGCATGVKRHFDIVAISVNIVYNKWGDHDPNGMMYVLEENEAAVKAAVAANPLTTSELVQPLTIRVNSGDCVEVALENELPFHVGITPQGVAYDVATSDGAWVGLNQDSTVGPGATRTFLWKAPREEGVHLFNDLGNALGGEEATNANGLFGALIVEPPGATWTDPATGGELNSGIFADIHLPGAPDFREYSVYFHDEPPILDRFGNHPLDPDTGEESSTFRFNYRSEPARNRVNALLSGQIQCAECKGEEVSLSSWPFGDPDHHLIPKAYVGDPTKFRVIHAGVKETHVFHLHVHQWLRQAGDPNSQIIDSFQISPQTSFSFDVLHGAGSQPAEPLFIRASAGECVDVNFTNKMPTTLGGNAFQPVYTTNESTLHIHLVNFDVLNSDGTADGWNYDQASWQKVPGHFQTVHYTWYADRELNTVFLHDHNFANLHQQHGYFAALIVEPAKSAWLNPVPSSPVAAPAPRW